MTSHISHRTYPEHRLCLVNFAGRIALEDFPRLSVSLQGDHRFSLTHGGICDMRQAQFAFTLAEYRSHLETEQARMLAAPTAMGPWAILLDSPREAAFQSLRQAIVHQVHQRIFCTFDAACEMVGIPPALRPRLERDLAQPTGPEWVRVYHSQTSGTQR